MRNFNPDGWYEIRVEKNGRQCGKTKVRQFKNEQQLILTGRTLAGKGKFCYITQQGNRKHNQWSFGN